MTRSSEMNMSFQILQEFREFLTYSSPRLGLFSRRTPCVYTSPSVGLEMQRAPRPSLRSDSNSVALLFWKAPSVPPACCVCVQTLFVHQSSPRLGSSRVADEHAPFGYTHFAPSSHPSTFQGEEKPLSALRARVQRCPSTLAACSSRRVKERVLAHSLLLHPQQHSLDSHPSPTPTSTAQSP